MSVLLFLLAGLLCPQKEMAVLGLLKHPNLVTLYGACRERGAYLVYELMEGGSLTSALENSAWAPASALCTPPLCPYTPHLPLLSPSFSHPQAHSLAALLESASSPLESNRWHAHRVPHPSPLAVTWEHRGACSQGTLFCAPRSRRTFTSSLDTLMELSVLSSWPFHVTWSILLPRLSRSPLSSPSPALPSDQAALVS